MRARETAEIVAERLALAPHEDARLVETDAGDWTDRLFSEVEAEDPVRFAAFARVDPDFAFRVGSPSPRRPSASWRRSRSSSTRRSRRS